MLDPSIAARRLEQEPPLLAARRRSAITSFEEAVMPTQATEHWKYIDLDFDLADFDLAGLPQASLDAPVVDGTVAATIIDGDISVEGRQHDGVTLSTFGDVAIRDADLLERGVSDRSDDIFLAASNAFADDGLFVEVAKNAVIAEPIIIDVQSLAPGTVSFPRIAVVLGENSEASVVVLFRSSEAFLAVVPVVESTLENASRLTMTTVQTWGRSTRGIGYQRVQLGRDSSFKMGEVSLGGVLGRLDLSVDLVGDGSSYVLNGLSFGDGEQVLDYRMVLNHRGRNTSSNVLLKGAVEDEAESIFTGLLRIEEGATNTSAFETNRNLVLSAGAKAHSVPNLEILCDDVVCGHGSTVGPLEEEHLYYLATRGIGRERAERVLVKGFFDEVIDRLPTKAVSASIRQEVERKFVAAQLAGRLG